MLKQIQRKQDLSLIKNIIQLEIKHIDKDKQYLRYNNLIIFIKIKYKVAIN